MPELNLPKYIDERRSALVQSKAAYVARASACEGAILELEELEKELAKPKKEEKKPNAK